MMKFTLTEAFVGGNLVSVSFKVDGSERARTQSVAREQGMAARTRQRRLSGVWQLCCAGRVTPSNAGLLIAPNYLIWKFMIIRTCLISAYCYRVKFFFIINDLYTYLLS